MKGLAMVQEQRGSTAGETPGARRRGCRRCSQGLRRGCLGAGSPRHCAGVAIVIDAQRARYESAPGQAEASAYVESAVGDEADAWEESAVDERLQKICNVGVAVRVETKVLAMPSSGQSMQIGAKRAVPGMAKLERFRDSGEEGGTEFARSLQLPAGGGHSVPNNWGMNQASLPCGQGSATNTICLDGSELSSTNTKLGFYAHEGFARVDMS